MNIKFQIYSLLWSLSRFFHQYYPSVLRVTNFPRTLVNTTALQLWPRGDGSPLCNTVTVTARLDEVAVTALNEEEDTLLTPGDQASFTNTS